MKEPIDLSDFQSLIAQESAGPRLIGGRHLETGRIVFPCPEGDRYEPIKLSSKGRLWSYTVQCFPPKSPPYKGVNNPAQFKPFFIGYVEIPGEVIVQTRLDVNDVKELEIGQDMHLVIIPFETPEGEPNEEIYSFRPTQQSAEQSQGKGA